MDVKSLRYFLAAAQEESVTGAAEFLHMTQPPLSRALKELETELGKQLFVRGSRRIVLTKEGMILRKRAEEIVGLMEKTKAEVSTPQGEIDGSITIGGGETEGVRLLARTIRRLQQLHPKLIFHFYSGRAEEVMEGLDDGLFDFGLVIEPTDMSKYNFIKLPTTDRWGLLASRDSPIAAKSVVRPAELYGLPLICSDQGMVKNEIAGWLDGKFEDLNVVAWYNLMYNASLLVDEGVGYALGLDGIINTSSLSRFCFVPLAPPLEVGMDLIWKKYQVFGKGPAAFLKALREGLSGRVAEPAEV